MQASSNLCSPKPIVLLYGTTPPRLDAAPAEIEVAAAKLAERIAALPLDALVVYDVQDESDRISEPRPFPFLPTLDSRVYSRLLREITGFETVTYKCVAQMTETDWKAWLDDAVNQFQLSQLSVVGAPTARGTRTVMSVSQAIRIAAARQQFTLGGVCIAERHTPVRSEVQRMLQKAQNGCSFFISQAVYSPAATIHMLRDYAAECQRQALEPKRVVLTFAPFGRRKTLDFIKWLGVRVPSQTEQEITSAPDPLAKSIEICCGVLRQILAQDFCRQLSLGVNVESVSAYKAEIDGSIALFHALKKCPRSTAETSPARPLLGRRLDSAHSTYYITARATPRAATELYNQAANLRYHIATANNNRKSG